MDAGQIGDSPPCSTDFQLKAQGESAFFSIFFPLASAHAEATHEGVQSRHNNVRLKPEMCGDTKYRLVLEFLTRTFDFHMPGIHLGVELIEEVRMAGRLLPMVNSPGTPRHVLPATHRQLPDLFPG